jgi:hypothetical protein
MIHLAIKVDGVRTYPCDDPHAKHFVEDFREVTCPLCLRARILELEEGLWEISGGICYIEECQDLKGEMYSALERECSTAASDVLGEASIRRLLAEKGK